MPNTLKYRINSKKSLCKSKKEKKCKKIKGCKMARGPKKTFCRKIRNKKYNKTKKTIGGFTVEDAVNMTTKSPLGSQLKAEAEKRIQQQKEQAKQRLMAEGQKILNKKLPIDENKLKIILSKLDEKKIKDLMQGIKNMDAQTINKIKSGDKEAIMKIVMQNPELRALLIGRLRQELTKNPEMQKLAMEVIKGSMGGDSALDEKLKIHDKNIKTQDDALRRAMEARQVRLNTKDQNNDYFDPKNVRSRLEENINRSETYAPFS